MTKGDVMTAAMFSVAIILAIMLAVIVWIV